ncbi:MAG: CDP-diacylglycerol--glycerol-3-phosphate 3-phosphatidyltransferase [Planctomycetota bacterium]|jgi:CDP-diacylglycerol--glycerol-3-phosphate 3-phosphatidyltransferase
MALNAIDGMLAREHAMKSDLGAILNEMGDVVADTAIYLPFALVPGIAPWQVVIFVVLAILSEMMGVVSVQIGASRRYDGPMGKSDRAFAIGLLSLLLGLGVDGSSWVSIFFYVLIGLTAITILNRSRRGLAELK